MLFENFFKKKFATKCETDYIEQKIEKLQNRMEQLEKENDSVKRILHFHVHGDISGVSQESSGYFMGNFTVAKTYVYKNGKEYIFENLYLKDPKFKQGDKGNIVYASSKDGERKYILDLYNRTYIEI